MKLSPRRKAVFFVAANILVLLFLELVCRLFNIGYNSDLFIEKTINKNDYYVTNIHFIDKFVPRLNAQNPALDTVYIPVHKTENAFRIVLIGESASQGFPYGTTESFPYQIKSIINNSSPQKKIEMINLSMAGITTYIGKYIAEESLILKPDLVLLYFGNNEFIGIGGSEKAESFSFQLNETLSHWATYRACKFIISRIIPRDSRSLFERSAREQANSFSENEYRTTINGFTRRYGEILSMYKESSVPVITISPAVNLRSLPPFISSSTPDASLCAQIDSAALAFTDTSSARMDTLIGKSASAAFYAAQSLLRAKKTDAAKRNFVRAKDLDLLRFRAVSDIISSIKTSSEKNNTVYVDAQQILDNSSTVGISGDDLFIEHVHPLLEGHFILAQNLSQIIQSRFVPCKNEKYTPTLQLSTITTLVEQLMTINKIRQMYTTYPFTLNGYFNPAAFLPLFDAAKQGNSITLIPRKDSPIEKIDVLTNAFSFPYSRGMLHVDFGAWLASRGDSMAALKEFLAALEIDPFHFEAIHDLGILFFINGEFDRGMTLMSESASIAPRNKMIKTNLRIAKEISNAMIGITTKEEFQSKIGAMLSQNGGFTFLQYHPFMER